jgi:hypothetical protein
MTLFDHSTLQATPLSKLDIWKCGDGCGFHLRAGSVVLTFSNEELEAFLRAAGGCYLGENCGHVQLPGDGDQSASNHDHDGEHRTATETLTSVLEH